MSTCRAVSDSRARRVADQLLDAGRDGQPRAALEVGGSPPRLRSVSLMKNGLPSVPLAAGAGRTSRSCPARRGGDERLGLGARRGRPARSARSRLAGSGRSAVSSRAASPIAEGAEHEQPRRLDVAQQVAEQQRRRRVRPLQVVEDQHRRGVARRRHASSARDRLEQAVAARLGVLGDRVAQLGQMPAQRGDEAGELAQLGRQLGGQRERVAVRHGSAGRRSRTAGRGRATRGRSGRRARSRRAAWASRASSAASRVLPIPGSPAQRARPGARSSAASVVARAQPVERRRRGRRTAPLSSSLDRRRERHSIGRARRAGSRQRQPGALSPAASRFTPRASDGRSTAAERGAGEVAGRLVAVRRGPWPARSRSRRRGPREPRGRAR